MSVANNLIVNSLSASTRQGYQRSWEHFSHICNLYQQPFIPASVRSLLVYISHCSQTHTSYNTVVSRISAVAYLHKLNSVSDSSQHFLVKKALLGYKNCSSRIDARKPVTLSLLHDICTKTSSLLPTPYDVSLLRAMFLLAFYGFLRLSEITKTPSTSHVLSQNDVSFQFSSGKVCSVTIVFKSYKHSTGQPFSLVINSQSTNFCPVQALHSYLQQRPQLPGPLFVFKSGRPVSPSYFNNFFKSCVALCIGNSKGFSSHSFRIGAATFSLQHGYSSSQITKMGRWRSNAVDKYLRVSSFKI